MGAYGRRITLLTTCAVFALLTNSGFAAPGDLNEEFRQFQESVNNSQSRQNQNNLNQEFNNFLKASEQELKREAAEYATYKKEILKQWDKFKGSTKKEWVDYSNNKSSRSIVNFEKGNVLLEVLIPVEPEAKPKPQKTKDQKIAALKKLQKQLERILTDSSIDGKSPIHKQLQTSSGKPLTRRNLQEFSKKELQDKIIIDEQPYVAKDGKKRLKAKVSIKMVPDHLKIRADKFSKSVKKYSKKYDVDPALVLAVIHTESYFNPKARSHIPAFGLMQLVPSSGGRDAYRHAFGKDKKPSASFLYKPENNIRLGTAYLDLLSKREFKKIKDPTSQMYLVIAAYNTGGGNVSRALTGSKNIYKNSSKINRMSSDQIYASLKRNLPYKETRDYIKKVSDRKKIYDAY